MKIEVSNNMLGFGVLLRDELGVIYTGTCMQYTYVHQIRVDCKWNAPKCTICPSPLFCFYFSLPSSFASSSPVMARAKRR